MSYMSRSSDDVHGYVIVKGTQDEVKLEEFEIIVTRYSEAEGVYDYYSEETYSFTDKDGVARDFQSEDELNEWLEQNGYTYDY